ncbi:sulfur carrier protein ThiS [Actibacterium pelagium]|uniref:Sulfur carrier protein n=1 Tax=Actibacterium pelagium TaxID=2029103 RepID=A0A917AIZ4_9RHOB|nr:sulfur carrier protein ThiS [Actibacterium pelagium]GGE52509.1 hypothetical protein GCM10011517_20340 [Actibacterium pelagium]
MQITVNGTTHDLSATTLADALKELGYGDARVATALNEAFIPAPSRATTELTQGDRLEVVAPMQGG